MALGKAVVQLAALSLPVLLAVTGPGVAVAAPGPRSPDVVSVAKRRFVPATQKEAILALQDMGDPAVETILRALKDGALYPWNEQIAILGGDGALKDVKGQPILDAGG